MSNVTCRPILYYCAVVVFWLSGITECMLFTFENKSPIVSGTRIFNYHL